MWLLPVFLLDGLVLYGVVGIFCLLALISMEYERHGIFTAIVVVALLVLEYYSDLHPLSFAYHNPLTALLYACLYFGVGTIWIIAKWFSHVYKVRDRFNEVKQECIDELSGFGVHSGGNPATQASPARNADGSLTEEGMRRVYRLAAIKIGEKRLPLQVSEHKAQIYMWWLLWPLSLIWTLLSDPITRLWNFVYNLFGGLMQSISNRAFKLD